MGPIPPGKPWAEIDREMIEELRTRRATPSNTGRVTPERVHQFLLDLEARFSKAGQADPAIIQEALAELRNEVGG